MKQLTRLTTHVLNKEHKGVIRAAIKCEVKLKKEGKLKNLKWL